MFNLNEKYFSISERCGRNHQNKFCLRPLKWTNVPGELKDCLDQSLFENSGIDSEHQIIVVIIIKGASECSCLAKCPSLAD